MILLRRSRNDWESIRRRMLQETEEYLGLCLHRPEMSVRIPAVRVGHGGFTRAFATAFWRRVLFGQ